MSNGITYQWQQKVGTGGWTNITGANSPIFAMPNGITFETDYRMWIACTNSALSDTTAPITVSIKPVMQCYCIPTDPTNQNTTPTVFYLSQFSTTNAIQNINFSATSQPPGGYADLTAQVVRQLPGQVVNFTTSCAGGENIVKLWIDYNQDGVFDNATETMHNFYTTVATQNGSFVVPSSLAAGQYRIRIKTYTMNIPNMTACDNIGMGSNIDFTLEVINAQPCSGIISTGTASGPSTICATIPFTIITTGGSTNVMGMTTYWQSSPVGANTWTNITGATFDTLNLSAGISAATDYRYVITCPNYSSSDTSNIVTVNITPGNQCYCTPPPPTFANTNWIDSVHTTGAIINFANMGSGFNNSGYSDYTATYALTTFPNGTFNLIVANQSSGVSGITVWIDWDQNGVFDATEQVFYTTSGSNGQMDIFTIPISVPANALSGSTRMRIRNYGSFGNDPCNQANQGEVEDYKVNIQVLMPCTGTLNAGVISNGNFSVCSLDSFSLVNTGFTIDSGITYHWQQKIGSGVWTNITGANAPTLNMPTGITASTAFRMWITCSGSNLSDTSDPVIVIIKPLNQCYCTPVYTMGGCNYGDVISNVTLNGLTTNINNSTGCSINGYTDYTYLTPADLNPGDTFALSVSTSSQLPTLQGLTAWIDYNHDGVFDLNEIILNTPNLMNVSGTATQNFVVPSSQLDGFYRMRVRLIYSPNYMPLDPCAPVLFGETEDYIVQIGAPSPIVPINFGVDTAICNNVPILLDAGIQPAGSTYFWSTGDTTQTINVNASGTYSVVVAYGTYYMIDSINVTVYPSPIVDLGADTLLCNGGSYIATAGNAPNNTYLWMPGGETTNSKIISTTGTYSVTVTNDLGCSTSDTINLTTGELPFVNGFTTTGTSPTYNFSPNTPLNVTDYLWDFGDGNSSTLQNPSHTYAVTGASKVYSVSLTISNDCGVQTELASVTVNGNDIKDLNLNSEILKLYPNPTRQTFTIENKSNFKMKNIIITNVLGQQVMKLAAKESKKVINVSNLASGLYQVTIEFDEGMVNKKLEVIK
ncbi:MAG TPA: GEVED domain-containing protein [Edaphocola sp.]|nr:GEVED domain-containing protein [Edaphocola sp.]